MNIWRLIPHHLYPMQMAEWSRRNGVIAIGWGGTGDLDNRRFGSERELNRLVTNAHQTSSRSNCVDGITSLWRLYYEIKRDDLVIITADKRRTLTMRVTGNYYYLHGDPANPYEHRRKAEVVPIDPDRLWNYSWGTALGENVWRTLTRCGRALTEAEFKTFL